MRRFKSIVFTMLLIAVAACTKTGGRSNDCGRVSFSLNADQIVTDFTRSNVSDFTTLPVAGDFNITITDSQSQKVWEGKLSAWDSSTSLASGNYSVTAEYGALETEGFDCPYFRGSASFTISGGQTSSVTVPVSLGNTVVRIVCSQSFKNYYPDYSFKFTREGADIVAFSKGETRGAFIDGYKITLEGTLNGETKTGTFSKEYTNLNEATAYTFNFDVTNAGGATITISFDNSTETIDLGEVELNN